MNNCAVIVISHKEDLSNFELVSLKQCCEILKNRSIYLIVPESLNIVNYLFEGNTFKIKRTKDKNLSTYEAFNKFKISLGLYWQFRKYDYILFYEPDAYVFNDNLDFWMAKKYSLIGAPWVETKNDHLEFTGVGNGGFSLRNVKSHIKALMKFRYIQTPKDLWREISSFEKKNIFQKLISLIIRLTIKNNTFFLFNDYSQNEDIFWSKVIPRYYNWYTIPEPKEALLFSFEQTPKKLYQLSNTLPMGCHAWPKYDLNFWSQFIEFER